jgi:hypothetical protein
MILNFCIVGNSRKVRSILFSGRVSLWKLAEMGRASEIGTTDKPSELGGIYRFGGEYVNGS